MHQAKIAGLLDDGDKSIRIVMICKNIKDRWREQGIQMLMVGNAHIYASYTYQMYNPLMPFSGSSQFHVSHVTSSSYWSNSMMWMCYPATNQRPSTLIPNDDQALEAGRKKEHNDHTSKADQETNRNAFPIKEGSNLNGKEDTTKASNLYTT
jgi:hypothetical protein